MKNNASCYTLQAIRLLLIARRCLASTCLHVHTKVPKKFASTPSFKNGTRNAPSHSPLASKTQETLCDGPNGTCKQTPGQREQRFCSSSQVIRNSFHILSPGIYNILHDHEKVGLRPPTRDCESNDCPGSPVPVCMQLHTYGGKVYPP